MKNASIARNNQLARNYFLYSWFYAKNYTHHFIAKYIESGKTLNTLSSNTNSLIKLEYMYTRTNRPNFTRYGNSI